MTDAAKRNRVYLSVGIRGTGKSVASALTETPVSTNYKKFELFIDDETDRGGVVR